MIRAKDVNDFLMSQPPGGAERFVCDDGFSMSVQASHSHYCSPRDDEGPWDKVEVGYPNRSEKLLLKYAETPSDPTRTVYAGVPVSVVAEVVNKHNRRRGKISRWLGL